MKLSEFIELLTATANGDDDYNINFLNEDDVNLEISDIICKSSVLKGIKEIQVVIT